MFYHLFLRYWREQRASRNSTTRSSCGICDSPVPLFGSLWTFYRSSFVPHDIGSWFNFNATVMAKSCHPSCPVNSSLVTLFSLRRWNIYRYVLFVGQLMMKDKPVVISRLGRCWATRSWLLAKSQPCQTDSAYTLRNMADRYTTATDFRFDPEGQYWQRNSFGWICPPTVADTPLLMGLHTDAFSRRDIDTAEESFNLILQYAIGSTDLDGNARERDRRGTFHRSISA